MAKKLKIDLREKSIEALKKDVADARSALVTLNLDNQMRKLKNTRSIFSKRKEIARILTIIKELGNAQQKKEVVHA